MTQTKDRAKRCRVNMLYNAKRRAREQNLPFDLRRADIEWGDACPCCGEAFDFSGPYSCRPSIDRLIPQRGYVRDNVVFICSRCNQRKSDMTPKEMYRIADFFWARIEEAIGAGTRSDDREESK